MPLTRKQKSFIENVAGGSSHSQAYRDAYNSRGNSATVRTEAHRLVNRPEIATAIDRRRDELELNALRQQAKEAGMLQSKRRAR